jgi:Na+-translocating ferredoxin:NAD+ oxidoreductase RnfC subunit
VLNLGRALDGIPVTEKWVTVAGNVPESVTLKVKIGTPFKEIFRWLGYSVPDNHVVLDGGPAMGNIVRWQEAVVTKTTKGILILPDDIPAVTAKMGDARRQIDRASSVCCQCTLCTEMCPRALLGYDLAPHRTVRSVASTAKDHPEDFLAASSCCGCGVCDLVACCQGILPRKVMMQVRADVAAKGMKYQPKGPVEPHEDRDFRLLPNKRFKSMIGVAQFDRMVPRLSEDELTVPKLSLPLKQHVGAPAQPVVEVGSCVRAGEVIAQAQAGISAHIHAPADGRVVRITDKSIELAIGKKDE